MRVPQPEGSKGSLKWLQRAIEHRPDLLALPGLPDIRWLSPLRADDFAEYRDAAFLERLGRGHLAPELATFWPRGGPQWDALGLAGDRPVLVEAKAHVGEFLSPASQAGPASHARIEAAFAAVQADLGIAPRADWTRVFYQYANRLAHLWWLHRQGVAAQLCFVSFRGEADPGIAGPEHAETWEAVFALADHVLGLPARHRLSRHIHHLTPPVAALG